MALALLSNKVLVFYSFYYNYYIFCEKTFSHVDCLQTTRQKADSAEISGVSPAA